MTSDIKLLDYLKMRRSTPAAQLRGPGPNKEELVDILSLAVRVPDHGKLAPWRFIVCIGSEREKWGQAALRHAFHKNPDLTPDLQQIELTRFVRAPVVIAVVSTAQPHFKVPEWEQQLSAGAVCLNLLMAVNAYGYVANWMTEWMTFDQEFLNEININSNEKVAGFIHIGSTDFPLVERPRPALADVVTWLGDV